MDLRRRILARILVLGASIAVFLLAYMATLLLMVALGTA